MKKPRQPKAVPAWRKVPLYPRPPGYAEATAGEPAADTSFGRGTADRFIGDSVV